jgi:hypothetical protein
MVNESTWPRAPHYRRLRSMPTTSLRVQCLSLRVHMLAVARTFFASGGGRFVMVVPFHTLINYTSS